MAKKNKKESKKGPNTEVKNNKEASEISEKQEQSSENRAQEWIDENFQNEGILQQKIDELNDKYLRLYSEYDNYRKRTLKEKLDLIKTASEEVITDLLPVIDDMERAIKSSETTENCELIREGLILIYNKLRSTLEKKGLKAIDSIGEEFDTDFHEAITFVPAGSDDMKGKVVEEVEKGYLLNEKVIRYTKAVIGQ